MLPRQPDNGGVGLGMLAWFAVASTALNVVHGLVGWLVALALATFIAYRVWLWRVRRWPQR